MKHNIHNITNYILGSLFLCIACTLPIGVVFCIQTYGQMDISMLLFLAISPLEGSNMEPFIRIIVLALVSMLIICTSGILLAKRANIPGSFVIQIGKHSIRFPFRNIHRFYALWTACLMFVSAFACVKVMHIDDYVRHQLSTTTIFDDYYVDPAAVELSFPEKKRNLIYIFVESMETAYADTSSGGNFTQNLIPELTKLQQENVGFTNDTSNINGALCTIGAGWTFAALVAQTAGVLVFIPSSEAAEYMGNFDECLPGSYSIGQILESQGYNQELLIGSDAAFGGRDKYFHQHGNYQIKDYYYSQKEGWIADDYYQFWGYEDCKLYEFAKKEITTLANQDEPFNFSMLTVDTHFFDGYLCEQCPNNFDNQYANVISCADKQLYNFIQWIKEQPFYENTTIVISGDHPTMDDAYMQDKCLSPDYERKVYTCVIHPVNNYNLDMTRSFTTLDLYPTTLSAMGVEISGNRLGFGTNLFSETPTLCETLGYNVINENFLKNSPSYRKTIFK